jgi:hypothetical protein
MENNTTFVDVAVLELTQEFDADPSLFRAPLDAAESRICDDPDPPQALQKPLPRYPSAARSSRIQGKVLLYLVVGVDGKVYNATPVQADATSLATASIDTITGHWLFRPAKCGDTPVPAPLFVETSFRLH